MWQKLAYKISFLIQQNCQLIIHYCHQKKKNERKFLKTKGSLKIDIRKPQEAEGRPEVQNKLKV